MAQQAISPNPPTLRKRTDAFDPTPVDVSEDSPATSAFSSSPVSDASRSPSGGANGPGISPTDVNHPLMQDLADVSGKLSAAYAAPRPGMARQVLGALLSKKNPGIGGLVSGETQRERTIQPLQQQYGMLGQMITANRAQQLAESQEKLRQAQEDYYRGRNPTALGVAETRGAAQLGVADTRAQNNLDVAGVKTNSAESIAADKIANPKLNDFDSYYKDKLDAEGLKDTPRNRLAARREYAAAGQPPQKEPQQLAIGPDGKVIALKPGVTVPQGTKSMSGDLGTAKTTSDEQRRADLANNLSENLDQLEEIAKRRPELFGPVAGRVTGAKQFIGTDDPDVAALKTIKEQTGMAMVGTHAMRNAQHVEAAADSITSANTNTSKALLAPGGPIAKARASLKTFLEKQPVVGGTPGGGTAGAQPSSGAIELERGPDGKLRPKTQ